MRGREKRRAEGLGEGEKGGIHAVQKEQAECHSETLGIGGEVGAGWG